MFSNLENVLKKINVVSSQNIIKSSKLLEKIQVLRTNNYSEEDVRRPDFELRNTSKQIVEYCQDSIKVSNKCEEHTYAIVHNDFNGYTFFQEIWQGDAYDKTGIDALDFFLEELISTKTKLEEINLDAPVMEETMLY